MGGGGVVGGGRNEVDGMEKRRWKGWKEGCRKEVEGGSGVARGWRGGRKRVEENRWRRWKESGGGGMEGGKTERERKIDK